MEERRNDYYATLARSISSLTECRDTVNRWMERFGVRFGIYKNNTFKEQLFPFDSVPRVIDRETWDRLPDFITILCHQIAHNDNQ